MRKELFAKLDEKDAAYRWQDFALKQVYGIEINSQLARVSMMNMIIHEDGHTNIENADALDKPDSWKRQKIREYFGKKFTLLLTNPPFGASVKEKEKSYLVNYELGGRTKKRNRQNTEILFIERCLDFLKPGGRMGIVLPDGILTNSSLQYVRDFINDKAQILGVVSLPQAAFKRPASKGSGDTGSGVKASLLFLRRKKEGEKTKDYPIFMAIADHIGYDATGRPDKDEFPEILVAWKEFRKSNRIDFFVKAPLCFAVGRGGIEGRWEPSFYKPEFSQKIEALKKAKFPLVDLGSVIKSIRYGTSSPPNYVDTGIPFIRATNIKDGHIIPDDMKFMTAEEAKNYDKCRLRENDLIIVRSGVNTGDCARITKEFSNTYAAYDLILALKSSINPEYINVFLNLDFGKSQINRVKARSAQAHLNANEVKSLRIPLLPREIQDKIASIMDEAYKAKKEKESEAEGYLNSIESYVLEELGIRIQTIQEKSPKVFSVAAVGLQSGRLDPFYYEPKYKAVDEAIKKGKYELTEFGEIISEISGGATPKAKGEAYPESGGIPFLRVQNITEEGIKLEDVKYISEMVHNGYLKRSKLKKKDLIFTITGRIGTVAVVPEDFGEGNINQHSVRIHLIEGVDERYIASFFNTDLGRSLSLRGVSGGTRIALDYEAIRSILIPLPPLRVQERIANGVPKIREKSKQLRKEAKELLEKAKREVEEFIEKK